jgi:hypothetical protein
MHIQTATYQQLSKAAAAAGATGVQLSSALTAGMQLGPVVAAAGRAMRGTRSAEADPLTHPIAQLGIIPAALLTKLQKQQQQQ